jgi:hypothetical protein
LTFVISLLLFSIPLGVVSGAKLILQLLSNGFFRLEATASEVNL